MYEKLTNYLNKWLDSGKVDYYLSAVECLDAYGFVGAWNEISEMLESETDLSVQALLDNIEVILQAGMDRVLGEHSITAHESSLRSKTNILMGLRMLVDDERHESILDICNNGEEVTLQLADLLAFVDPEASTSWVDYANEFTFASNGLITRLREIHETALANNQIVDDQPISPEKQKRFDTIRAFVTKYRDTLAAHAVIEDNVPLGLPMYVLIKTYGETLKSYDDKLPLLTATALVGLVLISDTPLDRLAHTAKDMIDEYFQDLDYIGLVAEAMEPLLNEVILQE